MVNFFTRSMPVAFPLLGFLLAVGINASLAASVSSEQALTVAFLYNFMKFAEWPKDAVSGDLTLCVADGASLGKELNAISGRLVQNRSVRIKRIGLEDSPLECQLLYLPREEKPIRIREWLKNTENAPILMVSNMDEFLDMGGMIVLIADGSRLQFEVDLKKIKRAGLNLSAQMLQIAREVRGK